MEEMRSLLKNSFLQSTPMTTPADARIGEAGGPPFRATQTIAFDFPGAASFGFGRVRV
jgi:hypothetical protein